jgi:hypothetical protein
VTLVSINCIFRVFIEGAMAFIGKEKAIIFINKGSLAIRGRLFKTAKTGVNRHNLRRQLITYKLKSLSVLINSLISTSDHSIGLFL